MPYQFKLDVFAEIEQILEVPHVFLVPKGVVGELKGLSRGRGKEGAAARFALKLLTLREHSEPESEGNVDDWIVEYAKKGGVAVATNDRLLRVKLKKNRVKVISLLSKSRVGVV